MLWSPRYQWERGASVTIAAARVRIAEGSAFGIMAVGPGGELRKFLEKPDRPAPIPDDPGHTDASMGNYLFDPLVLEELLDECHMNGETDFGRQRENPMKLTKLPCGGSASTLNSAA